MASAVQPRRHRIGRLSASQRGNLGLSTGPNGAFLIDDEYAPLTDRVRATVDSLCGCPVRFVLNTHWHRDHTGGNEHVGKAGVLIVAHENTRKRMSVEQFIEAFDAHVPAAPPGALPVVTFTDTITFHLNDDDIRAYHVAPAHTVKAGRSLAQVQAPRPSAKWDRAWESAFFTPDQLVTVVFQSLGGK